MPKFQANCNYTGKCYSDGGPHWLTMDAAYYGVTGTTAGKKWHPSVGMHLLRGEVLAYHYAYILLDAIHLVEKKLKKGTDKKTISNGK
jgi:hypothetical protein